VAFIIYFYYSYRISFQWQDKALRWLSLISLVGIPFMMEYFANCRGYGISVAGFMAGFYHISRYAREFRAIDLITALIALSIALLANASLLNLGLLAAFYLLVLMILHRKARVIPVLTLALFGGLVALTALYGLMLRESGALYYGNLNGLWDTTGASITRYTLFLTGWPAFWVVVPLTIILLVYFCYYVFSPVWRERIRTPFFLTNYLFFGSL